MSKHKTIEQIRCDLSVNLNRCQFERAKEIKLLADLKARRPVWQWHRRIIEKRIETCRARIAALNTAIDKVLSNV